MGRMIRTGRFNEFVSSLIRKHNEEANEKAMWEFFLSKVHDKSFEEFKNECKQSVANANIDVDALIQDIRQGLKGFKIQ